MKSLQMDDDGSSDGNSSRCLWQGELKSDLIRGVISIEGDILVIFYFWNLSWEVGYVVFSGGDHIRQRGDQWLKWPYKRSTTVIL
jgi:hypothetical protein